MIYLFICIRTDTTIKTNKENKAILSKLIVGCWQLDNRSWKDLPDQAIAHAINKYLDLGIRQFDTADIYGRSEALIGDILKGVDCTINTKAVFFAEAPSKDDLLRKVELSLVNLHRSSLNCIQVHMHYSEWASDEIFKCLAELKNTGVVAKIGVTNFNSAMLRTALDIGPLDYHQLQYSLIDRRVESSMQELCVQNDIEILAYGPLAGGYLSDRFIALASYSEEQGHARSGYYKRMIEHHGGWEKSATLFEVIADISSKHKLDASQVAIQWVLQQKAVGAVICGLTLDEQKIVKNVSALEQVLSEDDLLRLSDASTRSFSQPGDIYSYERPVLSV